MEKTPDFGYFSQNDDWAKRPKVHQKLGSGTCGVVWEGKNIFIFIWTCQILCHAPKSADLGHFFKISHFGYNWLKVHQKLGSGTCGLVWEGKNIFIFIWTCQILCQVQKTADLGQIFKIYFLITSFTRFKSKASYMTSIQK